MPKHKDETTQRGYTSLDDIDAYPKAAYRDRNGRRYSVPEFTARFDDAETCRKDRSPEIAPGPGRAMLDLFLCTNERADGTGVLLLDGEAVAAGDGRYQVEIDPGRHRLEVQGYDASTTEFTVAEGERACYSTGHSVAVRRQVEYRTELYRVHGSEGFMPLLSARASNVSGVGCLMSVIGAPLLVIGGVVGSFVPGVAGTVLLTAAFVGAVALVAGMTMGIVSTRRFHKRASGMRLEIERVSEPVEGGFASRSVAFPSPGDARDWARDRRVGGVLLVFDLFLYRLTRQPGKPSEYTGTGETMALAHAEGLRLRIDGAEAPCDWASWYYPLEPGEHEFAVDYGDGEASHEFTIEVPGHDDMTVVQVPVQVFRMWNGSTSTGSALPSRIAHKVVRKANSTLGSLNRSQNEPREEWIPGRYWPLK